MAGQLDGEGSTVQAWLLADEMHTILVFPYDWLVESGFTPPEDLKRKKYVAVSWGGTKAMIKQAGLNLPETLAAFYLPSSSVMECVSVNEPISEVPERFGVWTKKSVPKDRGPFVAAFLNHSVIFDENGKPRVIANSGWGEGVLLESPHKYHFPKMCNSWTSQAITAAGTQVSPIMALFPESVIGAAQRDGYVLVREAAVEEESDN
ncbi:MAG: DUF2459 domain-containing protein [Akkermansiaceae bacterium]